MKKIIFLILSLITMSALAEETKAITIALVPDQAMMNEVKAANKVLTSSYSQGFSFDQKHHPHMTLLQAFVHNSDLEKVSKAVEQAIKNENIKALKLETEKYTFEKWEDVSLATLKVKKTDQLVKLQDRILKAVEPFITKEGDESSFAKEEINKKTIDHAKNFIPQKIGEKYEPGITVGVAPKKVAKKLDQPKEKEFSASGIAIYKLGNFGTAQEKM